MKCEECKSPKGKKQACGSIVCDVCCAICHSMDYCDALDVEQEEPEEED